MHLFKTGILLVLQELELLWHKKHLVKVIQQVTESCDLKGALYPFISDYPFGTFNWPLCCLFLVDIRILITPLVPSKSSYGSY